VFARPGESTNNFEISKAIDRAVRDGCDLINLSLKQRHHAAADVALRLAIVGARNEGRLPIAAAGNESRKPVAFPASDDLCIAVTAMGRIGTMPKQSTSAEMVADPKGTDQLDFIGAMSNCGPEVDLTGPGVGIISTVPGDSYAVKEGTSMACAAVTGVACRLLAAQPGIMNMDRGASRSAEMARLLLSSAKSLGFGAIYEGQGRPT
jgi:subtilisin